MRLMSEMIWIPVSSNEVVLIEAAVVRGAVQRKNWSKLERSRAKKAATAGTRLAAALAASQRQTPVGSLEVVHLSSGQVAGQPLWQPQLSFAMRIDIIDLSSSQTFPCVIYKILYWSENNVSCVLLEILSEHCPKKKQQDLRLWGIWVLCASGRWLGGGRDRDKEPVVDCRSGG